MRKEIKIKAEQECIYSTNIYRLIVRTKVLQGVAEEFYHRSRSALEANGNLLKKTNSTCCRRMHKSKLPPPEKGIQTSEPGCPSG